MVLHGAPPWRSIFIEDLLGSKLIVVPRKRDLFKNRYFCIICTRFQPTLWFVHIFLYRGMYALRQFDILMNLEEDFTTRDIPPATPIRPKKARERSA
jgi:hypothetical protein